MSSALALICAVLAATAIAAAASVQHPTGLPGAASIQQATGFLPGAAPGVQLFYWLFEHPTPDAPLLVWLQGGPGASSLFGAFQENGPFRIHPTNLTLLPNSDSWLQHANLLYIDNPAGTGFSRGRLARNGSTLAADMVAALCAFYLRQPRFGTAELYIAGESFAGHMIPQIATALMESPQPPPLKGLAMGNGWTNPLVQNGVWGELGQALGFLGLSERAAVDAQYEECRALIRRGAFVESLQFCYSSLLGLVSNFSGGLNVYDTRMGAKAHDFTALGRYLNQADVRAAIGVGDATWKSFDSEVEVALQGEYSQDVTPLIAGLMDDYRLRVVVYSGQFDLICAALGTDRWVSSMGWSGQLAYRAASRKPWMVDGALAGYSQSSGLLRRVVVSNAGHYVPLDQPRASAEMIREWLLQ